jgi:hypothetical protein
MASLDLGAASDGAAALIAPAAAAPDAPAAQTAVAATASLRADVERLAWLLEEWVQRYLTRDWRAAVAAALAASDDLEAMFERLAALSDPAELLSVAAPLGATGFAWAVNLVMIDDSNLGSFYGLAAALLRAAESCAVHETVRASCEYVAGLVAGYEGDMAEGLRLLSRAQAVRARVLGPASREALDALSAMGRYKLVFSASEAEALFKEAHEGLTRLLGAGAVATLQSLCNQAQSLEVQGKCAEAEALYGTVLQGQEAALGPDHPDVCATAGHIGDCCEARKDLATAEHHFWRALNSCAAGLGEGHENTLRFGMLLACFFTRHERWADAAPLYTRAMEQATLHFGAADPLTLEAQAGLTLCLVSQKFFKSAVKLLTPVLEALGAPHESMRQRLVVLMVQSLAGVGRTHAALALAQRELPDMLAALGPENPNTILLTAFLRERATSGRRQREHGAGRRRQL